LRNNFSKEEIADLQRITEYFNNQICEDENSDLRSCFHKVFPDLLEDDGQSVLDNVDFEKQKELYHSISKSTFEGIWEFRKAKYYSTGLELKTITSRYNGKYQKYLVELGKNNTEIKKYTEDLIDSGDFEPINSFQLRIYKNPSKFNLDNPNIQLVIAVHYLTYNDQQKRTDKWISEK
jgi:hypothetical protein